MYHKQISFVRKQLKVFFRIEKVPQVAILSFVVLSYVYYLIVNRPNLIVGDAAFFHYYAFLIDTY